LIKGNSFLGLTRIHLENMIPNSTKFTLVHVERMIYEFLKRL